MSSRKQIPLKTDHLQAGRRPTARQTHWSLISEWSQKNLKLMSNWCHWHKLKAHRHRLLFLLVSNNIELCFSLPSSGSYSPASYILQGLLMQNVFTRGPTPCKRVSPLLDGTLMDLVCNAEKKNKGVKCFYSTWLSVRCSAGRRTQHLGHFHKSPKILNMVLG